MGQLIIFEGLDGSGKGTQTKLTAQRLQQQGYDLRQITFPDYDSESSALVRVKRCYIFLLIYLFVSGCIFRAPSAISPMM